jgi:Essential protein Yae1, N terminal
MRDLVMYTTPILGALLAGGSVLIAYNLGYRSGFQSGQSMGFEQGKKEGAREGARRGFAVGYDRGKRATVPDEDEEDDEEEVEESGAPSAFTSWRLWSALMLLGLGLYLWTRP